MRWSINLWGPIWAPAVTGVLSEGLPRATTSLSWLYPACKENLVQEAYRVLIDLQPLRVVDSTLPMQQPTS